VRLQLEQQRDGERLLTHIRVADTGVGIKPEDQALLFNAFARVDAGAARRRQGSGLGLHLSQKLAQRIGGRIGVESEPGKGSVFTVTLPSDPAVEPVL
jgi:two-component system sensor histidine kinase EvgS